MCVRFFKKLLLFWVVFFWLINFSSAMTSLECQTEYNLIPISSIDSNYCSVNWLCSEDTWDVQWSALYINDIQHQSSPIIWINIPEEISWDYTWDESSFYLDINGYNVDSDYINWIIATQSSMPDQSDFNSLVSNVLPLFIPWLVIILFIYFVFRFVKKIF